MSNLGYGRLHTNLARIIHLSPMAMCMDARDRHPPDSMSSGIGRRVESLYALMESLRDDKAKGAVPVTVVVSEGSSALDARLPGLYQMDGLGDLVVASTDGVAYIERRATKGQPQGPARSFH